MKKLAVLGGTSFLVPLFFILFLVMTMGGGKKQSGSTEIVAVGLPAEVLQYKEIVEKEAKANGISDQVHVLLAIMAVETGGRGNDVMQSSESLGLPPNSLQPLESIRQGVKYYANLLQTVREKGCDDEVAIGSYNFGGGYISFVEANGKKHSLDVAERFSLEVVAPSLGNSTGKKYSYPNPIANGHGNYLYLNGGNFYYVDLVKQYLSTNPANKIAILESVLGQSLYNGECYGLTAYYVDKLGGPQLMGSGFQNASDIGTDYDWEKYGWKVILNPKYSEIQAGDIVNFAAGNGFAVPYGHTGICQSVEGESVKVYDQWNGHGCTVSHYGSDRKITSIVRKLQ